MKGRFVIASMLIVGSMLLLGHTWSVAEGVPRDAPAFAACLGTAFAPPAAPAPVRLPMGVSRNPVGTRTLTGRCDTCQGGLTHGVETACHATYVCPATCNGGTP